MMPVIFLDFDGVLNNRHYRHSGLGVFLVSDRTLDGLINLAVECLAYGLKHNDGFEVARAWCIATAFVDCH